MAKQAQVKKPVTKVKRKVHRNVPSGIVHVTASFNNTIVSIADPVGNVISWASAGKVNFSGSRKSSAFAATVAAQNAARDAMGVGMKECEVNLSGPGAGREYREGLDRRFGGQPSSCPYPPLSSKPREAVGESA